MSKFLVLFFPFVIFARVFLISDSDLNSRSSGMRNSDFAMASYNVNNFSNPAFLAEQKEIYFSSTYYNYFSYINMGNLTFSYPGILQDGSSSAFSLSSINYGKFTDIDTGMEYTPFDLMLTVSQGFKYSEFLIGANLKYIYSSISEDYNSSAIIVDFGTLYRIMEGKIAFGAGLFDAGTQLDEYYETGEDIVAHLRTGLCYRLDKLPMSISAQHDYYFNDAVRYAIGFEFDAKKNLIIRAGYDFSGSDKKIGTNNKIEKFGGLSLGTTLLLSSLGFDFSYLINGELEDEFCVTLNFKATEMFK